MKAKKIKRYCAEYKTNGRKYCSDIWAFSLKEAELFAKRRNIGEKVIGNGNSFITDGFGRKVFEDEHYPDFTELNDWEFVHQLPKIIHSACFLSMIALKSGTSNIENTLGDIGVLHELIHLLTGGEITQREVKMARGKFMELQKSVIGNKPLK